MKSIKQKTVQTFSFLAPKEQKFEFSTLLFVCNLISDMKQYSFINGLIVTHT